MEGGEIVIRFPEGITEFPGALPDLFNEFQEFLPLH
jgi:hypothetical protein